MPSGNHMIRKFIHSVDAFRESQDYKVPLKNQVDITLASGALISPENQFKAFRKPYIHMFHLGIKFLSNSSRE